MKFQFLYELKYGQNISFNVILKKDFHGIVDRNLYVNGSTENKLLMMKKKNEFQ